MRRQSRRRPYPAQQDYRERRPNIESGRRAPSCLLSPDLDIPTFERLLAPVILIFQQQPVCVVSIPGLTEWTLIRTLPEPSTVASP